MSSKRISNDRRRKSHNVNSSNTKKKPRLSTENAEDVQTCAESGVSPESLAKRLDRYCNEFANAHKNEYCELVDYEIDDGVENMEKLREMREKLCKSLVDFDFAGRTDMNLDGAALAGAKVLVEERAATRSITKRLTSEVGVDQENLLYSGLPYEGAESNVAKDIHDERTESILESFVDFQKQIKFKLSVLGHAIKKIELQGKSKSAKLPDRIQTRKCTAQQQPAVLKNANRTPKKCRQIEPLSFNRIIDGYALEVASEVTSKTINRKNLRPIPFNLDILDEA